MSDNGMACVGAKDAVLAFKALGIQVFPADTAEEAQKALTRAAKSGCAVILITEAAAAMIPEAVSRYRTAPTPAIIPIPGASGATGLGMANVRANVEKAIGADILLDKG